MCCVACKWLVCIFLLSMAEFVPIHAENCPQVVHVTYVLCKDVFVPLWTIVHTVCTHLVWYVQDFVLFQYCMLKPVHILSHLRTYICTYVRTCGLVKYVTTPLPTTYVLNFRELYILFKVPYKRTYVHTYMSLGKAVLWIRKLTQIYVHTFVCTYILMYLWLS
jgi:hypothetical protein